jgi:4-hydroxyproline epimerase
VATPEKAMRRVRVIDSHTGGEPTRVVVTGGPDLGGGSLAARRALFRERHDDFRSAVVNEPRGSDVAVGALLCEPSDLSCVAGVIFFNNVGYLGMCGHGTIGVAETLAYLGRIGPGTSYLETPVGVVSFDYHGNHRVTVENVPSYRHASGVRVHAEPYGDVTGDVAWGGNWFFLVEDHRQELELANVSKLLDFTHAIQLALYKAVAEIGIPHIDHIELFGPPRSPGADSRSFVLCPGGAYDRSPCGTGTSAKLACLAADGKLRAGEVWRQESIIGSVFEATYRTDGDKIIPRITGSAYVNGEATLILDPDDPFAMGIRG